MKTLATALLAGAALAFGAGSALADGELHFYNYGDYTNPDLIKKFEKTYNVKVTLDTYDASEDMYAKVKAGGSGYDVVVPASFLVEAMVKDGLLAKIEPDQMSNFKYMRPEFVHVYWDDGRHYSVPWQWGTTGPTVNTEFYKGDINTWAVIFDPPVELKGRVNVEPGMTDVLNAASYYLGQDPCTADKAALKKLNDTLLNAKKSWRTMDYDTIGKMTSKDAYATLTWDGAAIRQRLQVPTIKYGFPKEGMESWMDNVVVLKDAPNMENAKLFINFIMAPENAALISAFAHYDNGSIDTEQYLPPELKGAPEWKVPAGVKTEFLKPCSQEVVAIHSKIWNNLLK
jgi:spermidine/putrescine transport system substrate-binding protein